MPVSRSIRSIVAELDKHFADAGLDDPRREARLLIAHVLGRPLFFIHAHPEQIVDSLQVEQILAHAERRRNREPLAWITGRVDFCDLTFDVGQGVLVPRPDSEILVETACQVARSKPEGSSLRILDCCTGSGCIGISLAICLEKEGYTVDLDLTDLDPVALRYARMNLINHGLGHRARLYQADLFPSAPTDPYDLIVANPPYVDTAIIETLMPEVSRHEPRLALDGGSDGLDICRRLIQQAPQRLALSGWLLLEHGYDQASSIAQLLTEAGFAQVLPVVKDYGGQPRVSGGCI